LWRQTPQGARFFGDPVGSLLREPAYAGTRAGAWSPLEQLPRYRPLFSSPRGYVIIHFTPSTPGIVASVSSHPYPPTRTRISPRHLTPACDEYLFIAHE